MGILGAMTYRARFLVVALALATLTSCTDAPAEREVGEVPQSEPSSTPTPPSSTETPGLLVEQVAGGPASAASAGDVGGAVLPQSTGGHRAGV